MVEPIRPRLTKSDLIRQAPFIGAGLAGGLFALGAIALPTAWLEDAVTGSAIAAVLTVAEPPLGATARAVLALVGGVAFAAVTWAALYLLMGPGGPLAAKKTSGSARRQTPTVRRADAHPDAPPRWPLSATELPAPPPPVAVAPVQQDLPADLDMPLAAFDPAAVLPVPMTPSEAVKPLAPALAPGERMETFALAIPARPAPPPSDEPPSIDALLRRLEQGAQRRVARG
ncbi:MAG: hypothetical protein JWN21_2187 [Sphingomonas bacterium]|uniref:hypothetical protein n=1 Tax=Sphingomonas bacterium TaxID=1895847 RepID=UPI002603BBBC|nr:hypothetical protein [Sphingomonas bacterium]MDB5696644.1 hypothetical protein [Sphingomonas bacterium]